MKKALSTTGAFILLFSLPYARGQSIAPSTINASGGSAVTNNNVYEWSVGEMALVSTFTGSNIIVTQGVLQADPQPNNVRNTTFAHRISVYPNPAENVLNLKYELPHKGTLTYEMLDAAGRNIYRNTTAAESGSHVKTLDLSKFAVGHYVLNVSYTYNGKRESTSFKIQKNN